MTSLTLSNFLLDASPKCRHRPLSRSTSPRPSLASVSVLLLHPATLRPVSERRTSTHSASESAAGNHVVAPDDADRLTALPSTLPTTYPQHISSFPETAAHPSTPTSSGVLSSSRPPSSPDLLDSIILAEDSGRKLREYNLQSVYHWPSDGVQMTFVQNGTHPARVCQLCLYLGALKPFPRHLLSSALCSHQVLVTHGAIPCQLLIRRRRNMHP